MIFPQLREPELRRVFWLILRNIDEMLRILDERLDFHLQLHFSFPNFNLGAL